MQYKHMQHLVAVKDLYTVDIVLKRVVRYQIVIACVTKTLVSCMYLHTDSVTLHYWRQFMDT